MTTRDEALAIADQLGQMLAATDATADDVFDVVAALTRASAGRPASGPDGAVAALRAAHDVATAGEGLRFLRVADARAAGVPWARIGDVLGVSKQAVQQRFGRAA